MTITFNSTSITDVTYNGTDCTTVIYNGTTVFSVQRYLKTTGRNNYGQLGLGDVTNRSSFTQVGTNPWSSGSAGQTHAAAIRSDGTLWTWGSNTQGQLGLGNSTNYSSPKQVGSLTNWSKVSAAYNITAVIKTDGTLWTWGSNTYGRLGRSGYGVNSPVQVGALTNWRQIFVGAQHATAIKTDGTLWTWGNNSQGQLGLGNRTNYSSPMQVGSLTDWQSVVPGYYTTLAIKTNGTIWTWGLGAVGRLGLGNTNSYSSPKQIGSLTTWSTAQNVISSSLYNSAAIKNGELWVWGYNTDQLMPSVPAAAIYSSPIQVGALSDWATVSIAPSGNGRTGHAVKTDKTLWGWGNNGYGGIGNGAASGFQSSPVQVGYGTSWKSCSSSGTFTMAITV